MSALREHPLFRLYIWSMLVVDNAFRIITQFVPVLQIKTGFFSFGKQQAHTGNADERKTQTLHVTLRCGAQYHRPLWCSLSQPVQAGRTIN